MIVPSETPVPPAHQYTPEEYMDEGVVNGLFRYQANCHCILT